MQTQVTRIASSTIIRGVIVKRRRFSGAVRTRFSVERRQLACNRRQLADGILCSASCQALRASSPRSPERTRPAERKNKAKFSVSFVFFVVNFTAQQMQDDRKTPEVRAQMTNIERLRHSTAHVLATAILVILSGAKDLPIGL
jgi:tellurite resistance protein